MPVILRPIRDHVRHCATVQGQRQTTPMDALGKLVGGGGGLQDLAEDLGGEVGSLHLHHLPHHSSRLLLHLLEAGGGHGGNLALEHGVALQQHAVAAVQHHAHDLAQDGMHLLHCLVSWPLEKHEALLQQASVTHFGGHQVGLVPVRLADDLVHVGALQHLAEVQPLDALRQPRLEYLQDSFPAALAAVDGLGEGVLELAAQGEHQVNHAPPGGHLLASHGVDLLPQRDDAGINGGGDLGELHLDGFDQLRAELGGQEVCPDVGAPRVRRVTLEERQLVLARRLHAEVVVNVLLPAVDHGHPPVLQPHRPPVKHLPCVGSPVHDVQLRQHTDGALASRIHFARQVQRIRGRQIGIGGGHCKNNGVLTLDVCAGHVFQVLHNGLWLPIDRHLCKTRHINHGQVGHVGGVDGQLNWIRGHRLPHFAQVTDGLLLNLPPDVIETSELAWPSVQELPVGHCVGIVNVNQLEHQRPLSHDTRPSRQEICAHH
mmetsp:Transcript_5727/g.16369  ORF Transcript_5727/g.16369 Transcript_5727/m.16369 type:complete len:487 (+) Transcript_5727:798-2258(+)